jgi:hypothetical protein
MTTGVGPTSNAYALEVICAQVLVYEAHGRRVPAHRRCDPLDRTPAGRRLLEHTRHARLDLYARLRGSESLARAT